MFQEETCVCAVETVLVVAVRSPDVLWLIQRFAEISAQKVFVTDFSSEGRGSASPFEIVVQVCTVHIGLVVVERIGLRIAAEQLKAVVCVVPVQRRIYREPPLQVMSLNGSKALERMLKLIVVGCSIETVGTPVLIAEACIPVNLNVIIPELALIESLKGLLVHVQAASRVSGIAITAGI